MKDVEALARRRHRDCARGIASRRSTASRDWKRARVWTGRACCCPGTGKTHLAKRIVTELSQLGEGCWTEEVTQLHAVLMKHRGSGPAGSTSRRPCAQGWPRGFCRGPRGRGAVCAGRRALPFFAASQTSKLRVCPFGGLRRATNRHRLSRVGTPIAYPDFGLQRREQLRARGPRRPLHRIASPRSAGCRQLA